MNERTGYAARMEKLRNTYKILGEESEGYRPFGKPRGKRERIILKELALKKKYLGWIQLAHARVRWR
jgi:hypothetical protein